MKDDQKRSIIRILKVLALFLVIFLLWALDFYR